MNEILRYIKKGEIFGLTTRFMTFLMSMTLAFGLLSTLVGVIVLQLDIQFVIGLSISTYSIIVIAIVFFTNVLHRLPRAFDPTKSKIWEPLQEKGEIELFEATFEEEVKAGKSTSFENSKKNVLVQLTNSWVVLLASYTKEVSMNCFISKRSDLVAIATNEYHLGLSRSRYSIVFYFKDGRRVEKEFISRKNRNNVVKLFEKNMPHLLPVESEAEYLSKIAA